ncbi:DEAD/DEAH box helicase [Actibacterium sp. XHP0104]|uniref:DEAD/DEAH box helicase n=1 Tax=Actibacterium sp. XHP0104 TaxID=2984335 RepID=UPI0021E7054D|nr:DEAD/DEAH box helicase [Actibacterium sp. XHP0104]MCV2880956.1 DEAD/DEAH box helicase [Actibacterium sp. XHP0104]
MIQTLSDALKERGYDTLTAVQEAVCDPELHDSDLLVSAQTGSGKTVGFGLAIAPTLLGDAEVLGFAAAPLALIVAPTRELAFQVMREIQWLYAKAGARVTTCIGGMDIRDERRALDRGAHIVVGTPGRLRDHIQRGSLDMSSLRVVVLDEADEMLDLGFREDLEFLLSEAPDDRRTLMFSATVPPMIAKLAQQFQRDAVRVTTLTGQDQHADISYQVLRVAQQDIENAIINVLRYHDAQNAIVFTNTRAAVNRLTARLSNRAFPVVALSGELSQTERTHALQAMRDGRARVCVATDVAARGIDLPNLDLVIHAELPSNAEGLLHRSGRTGRAGRKGISALIVPPKIAKKAERLLKFAKIEAEWMVPPSADDVLRKDEERLLADPVWSEKPTPEQEEFAAKLLALHSPEQIAAAYIAMYRARQSAPEDLAAPDAPPARKERKPFGPSEWFSLSVGHDDRADPRWLLPLLCRAGNLEKGAIGAIRIRQSESFVELAKDSVGGFLQAIGEGAELEEGVKVRQLDAAPDLGPAPRKHEPKPRKPEYAKGPAKDGPRAKPRDRAPKRPSKMEEAIAEGVVKPYRKSRGEEHATPKAKPPVGQKPAPKPHRKSPEKAPGSPSGKPGPKAATQKDKRAAPATTGARKPGGKPAAPRRAHALDSSKRVTPTGAVAKPRKSKTDGRKSGPGKPHPGRGGGEPPRRR